MKWRTIGYEIRVHVQSGKTFFFVDAIQETYFKNDRLQGSKNVSVFDTQHEAGNLMNKLEMELVNLDDYT